ncbi:glycosyltransferase [Niabella ginsenosidivorans]|uniref:glycosyltransferase n=1 Tax=Niabella ginsenosidivorans TaxID=1176587 RepID=UPI001C54C838|nr:glycosyltransferase [Niabella ginsenosidivorans]
MLFIIYQIRKRIQWQTTPGGWDHYDIGVIITAYQQMDLVEDAVASILKSTYDNYLIYVVADACDITGVSFKSDRVILLRPEKVLSSNTKSHFFAIENFRRAHNIITIIDSDNLVDPHYLSEIANKMEEGFDAVQGVRAARNLNTVYACLDEAGDIFYRFIDRLLLYGTGSSASLAGSGMAFDTEVYKKMFRNFTASGAGFDKYLQYQLVNQGYRIAFTSNAIVYDGKTDNPEQLVKQRARWINAWFKHWVLGVKLFFKSIFRLNWNQFAFSIMIIRPPLFMLAFLSAVMVLLNLLFTPAGLLIWTCSFVFFIFLFFYALDTFKAKPSIYQSLKQIPRFMYYQVVALFKAKKANTLSVATKHNVKAYK